MKKMVSEEIKEAIKLYHQQGYSYRLIHYLLEKRHNCVLSFSYVQKKLIPSLGLRRRGPLTASLNEIFNKSVYEISNGVAGSEQLRRTMAVKHTIRVTRKLSRALVRAVDEDGVLRRKCHRLRRRQYISKGPNYVWHLDGYDKLAPFGIYIHGCIDGFSRKVMWLRAGITNKRPEVVGQYFVDVTKNEGGFPRKVRGDCGTENTLVARMQREILGNDDAFQYGRSTSNQRIERWWGYLRNTKSDFWIHQFKLLESEHLFVKANPIHRLCLQYTFLPVISRELDEIKTMWNTHSIRKQKNGDTVPGIPDVLYTHAELHDVQNYLHPVNGHMMDNFAINVQNTYLNLDRHFINVAEEIADCLHLPSPSEMKDFQSARHYYIVLVDRFSRLL